MLSELDIIVINKVPQIMPIIERPNKNKMIFLLFIAPYLNLFIITIITTKTYAIEIKIFLF